MNPFHAPFTMTQDYGPTGVTAEPALNGYPHFHRGIDIVGPSATCQIYPTTKGKVFACGVSHPDLANFVIIEDGQGYYHCYWHLSVILCQVGQEMDGTDPLGHQGNTGWATGYHLHYEVEEPGDWKGLLSMTCTSPHPFITAGGSDMDTHQIAKDFYQVLTGGQPADDIINQKADYMENAGNTQQVLLDILNSIPWRNPGQCDMYALEIYDEQRNGADPQNFALKMVQGGETFRTVYFRDKAIDAAAQQGKETAWINQVSKLSQELSDCQKTASAPAPPPVPPPSPAQPIVTPPASPVGPANPPPAKLSFWARLLGLLANIR